MPSAIIRLVFYAIWFFGAVFQAYFTQISGDEAYYWMYSNDLAWGYFDHPPVIAGLIKAGYSIFGNELGVRFLPAILSTFSIFFIERIVQPKNLKIFFLLIYSIGILHFMSFTAIPDSPLLFSLSIFLLLLKKSFLKPQTLFYQ